MYRHEDKCRGFAEVLGDLIIPTPTEDEAAKRPYAISNGKTYDPISYCPYCGWTLLRMPKGLIGWLTNLEGVEIMTDGRRITCTVSDEVYQALVAAKLHAMQHQRREVSINGVTVAALIDGLKAQGYRVDGTDLSTHRERG